MLRRCLILFFIPAFIIACKESADEIPHSPEELNFRMLKSAETGVDFRNQLHSSQELNILTYLYFYNGAGVAAADFNNDGLADLFFSSNQGANKLYLNLGGMKFRDISLDSGMGNVKGWATGVSLVDINNDGFMDIYVCEVGDYKSLQGHNRLYVNKGPDENGIPGFKEEAHQYNLDFRGFSTQASFFDYDLDGDLDMFLMNHSVHPNSSYGKGSLRNKSDSLSGDRLYRNDNGKFKDVSSEAGIYSSKIGYGLGLATGDLNNDGYPDIYVGNDFFENDYVYINQQDGTFKDIITQGGGVMGHTSHYSMGVDIGDLNNDGLEDIVSLDMLPEDLTTYKVSGTDYSYPIYHQYLNNGYAPQYMQNAFQLNRGQLRFSEIGQFSGIAATEWSWAPLIADLDNDGLRDLFISNGILGATNDMDFISFIANENIQKRISEGMSREDLQMIEEIPQKKTQNYFFKNRNGTSFQNMTPEWVEKKNSFSNGAIYADLDNDGDLDIVTNNVNQEAFIYQNLSREKSGLNYLNINFRGNEKNPFGIGALVVTYFGGGTQASENYPTRGYLSAVEPKLHFGLGKAEKIDSLEVIWPDHSRKILRNIAANQELTLKYENTGKNNEFPEKGLPISRNLKNTKIASRHKEYSFKDFIYEPLIPYSQSNLGPSVSVLDFNKDGREDLFVSGDKFQPGRLWLQDEEGKFQASSQTAFENDKNKEPVDQVFLDVDADGDNDLLIVFGGNDLQRKNLTRVSLYLNENGKFKSASDFPNLEINASLCRKGDFNGDGAPDIFIASNASSGSYGGSGDPVILMNNGKGQFHEDTSFGRNIKGIDMIYDAEITDLDEDGLSDIILAAHYMPITFLINNGNGSFSKKEIDNSEGWWNEIELADFDEDGDLDLIVGNWGLNSRLKASDQEPLQLYLQDFDDNGRIDPVLTYFYQGRETPLATKDELAKQLPVLNKNYLSYTEFAKADFNDYFSEEKRKNAKVKKAVTLETTYFENTGNFSFRKKILPPEVQYSSINSILAIDWDGDGWLDIVMAGNSLHLNTQLGRQDAGYGLVLKNTGNGGFQSVSPNPFYVKGAVKSLQSLKIKDEKFLVFGINNDSIQFVKQNL